MSVRVNFGVQALIQWARITERKPAAIRRGMVNALNHVGDKLVNEMSLMISAQTQMPQEQIKSLLQVQRATTDKTSYTIDAARALIEEPANRPMGGRRRFARRPEGYFHPQELVKIVDFGDEKVCKICQDLADGGPYSIEDARSHLPAHPNCRCVVSPYRMRREMPVEIRKGRQAQVSMVTVKELISQLSKETKIALKVH